MFKLRPGEFVQQSLDLNLFFLRIMMEHSFFIEAAFVPRDSDLARRADRFRLGFEELLKEAVELADCNVSRAVLKSGEVVTDKTLRAEEKTQFLSGVDFNTGLTRRETQLTPGAGDPGLERPVSDLNEKIIRITKALVDFKTKILEDMLNCRLFTWNFPLLIEHIRREALFFIKHLQRLQKRTTLDPTDEIIQEKVFWDRIMAEHSLFIVHLLDPTEKDLIMTAADFAREFFALERRARDVENMNPCIPPRLMRDEINATGRIREFKDTADELILDCKIRSIIIPLLADHVLREANHFYALLTRSASFTKEAPGRQQRFRSGYPTD
ncbi:MAG: DUF2935 domain-containing protein [Syntrophomonadaceae bacterium]|jgi:hypothetical protein